MARDKPTPHFFPAPTIEHGAESIPPLFTGWHYFLAHVLQKTRSLGLDVHCFVKLGSLPLEADVIVLHLDKNADIELFAKYFSFLVPSLRPYLVLEYKGPDDRLTLDDFDTVRAYAMLCKRKYQVTRDEDVAVAMLYSHTEVNFFAGCADNGFPFVQTQVGVRASSQQRMGFYAIDLVAVGEQQPDHPINLLSARRCAYGKEGLGQELGPFGVLYEEVFLREVKKMSQTRVPGSQEILNDAERLEKFLVSRASVETRLAGIAPEELVRRLSFEERLRGLPAEERLRGLPTEERLRGLPAEERVRDLSPAEKARLRKLLESEDR